MPQYRVFWVEEKTIVVEADSPQEAEALGLDVFYDKATLWDSHQLDTEENPTLFDDEKVWTYND